MATVELYPKRIGEDLARSGLAPEDMRIRVLGPNERHATNTPQNVDGYVIPYFGVDGKPIPFYRVRLYDFEPKYKQLANQPNHIYFPPGFQQLVDDPNCKSIILVEGEKKSKCAVSHGYAACAVGGVDSWRNRIVHLPKDVALAQGKGTVVAKLPSGVEATEKTDSLAHGMKDLIDIIVTRQIPLVIIYDSDTKSKVKHQVQAAAAVLGYELRARGVPSHLIRQLILQRTPAYLGETLGLDDYLMHEKLGPEKFAQALNQVLTARGAFPQHPNPREYVNKKLQRSRMPRADMAALSMAILSDLDAKGSRLHCPDDDTLYYFSNVDKKLIPVSFRMNEDFSKTPFGIKLYRDYNIATADYRIMEWLSSQFAGEQPISEVKPQKVLAMKGDALYYQVSGGRMIRVDANSMRFLDNGQDDVLFQADLVDDLDEELLKKQIELAKKRSPEDLFQWYPVLQDARIKHDEGDRARLTLALLYSISPWFYRWRGTQLPIEMMIAEPGSGKSTLYVLRLNILTGIPTLRNAPREMRDWVASVAATGGLHVTDNVVMNNTGLRQELSDELCRLITEPDPHIEARKLYSDNTLIRTPVKCVFAVTAIKQPFANADIIARSIITDLDKGDDVVEYEAKWEERQLLRYGGREGWLANQFVFLQRMFQLIQEKWDPRYRAKFRLINVEQLLLLAAEVFGLDASWLPEYLEKTRNQRVSDSDWALAGLKEFGRYWFTSFGESTRFTTTEIAEWAAGEAEFESCNLLTNPRQLGQHLSKNKNLISVACGISEKGTMQGRVAYHAHLPRV